MAAAGAAGIDAMIGLDIFVPSEPPGRNAESTLPPPCCSTTASAKSC
jgi:hypothetical protein